MFPSVTHVSLSQTQVLERHCWLVPTHGGINITGTGLKSSEIPRRHDGFMLVVPLVIVCDLGAQAAYRDAFF